MKIKCITTHHLNEATIGQAHIVEQNGNILAINIDLPDKGLMIESYSDGRIYLNDRHIDLPSLKDWDVFSASICRYTLSVCLIKRQ